MTTTKQVISRRGKRDSCSHSVLNYSTVFNVKQLLRKFVTCLSSLSQNPPTDRLHRRVTFIIVVIRTHPPQWSHCEVLNATVLEGTPPDQWRDLWIIPLGDHLTSED